MTEKSEQKILVWDAPVRLFHWLMVLSFAGAYLTAESDQWRLLHVTLGYTLGGLVAFRVIWGLMGTRYARFSAFLRGPAALVRYLRSLAGPRPEHHTGHNPAGAVAIVLMLLTSVAMVATGWANYNDVGGEWVGELHEGAANFMLLLVFVHVAGVLLASFLHRENLVKAMVTGHKSGQPEQSIRRAWYPVALVMLVVAGGFWWLQWQSAPSATATTSASHAKVEADSDDD
ncbi:MAG: cytochrome b/b6 domain-containing protein [Pseudomonadota bacterium]